MRFALRRAGLVPVLAACALLLAAAPAGSRTTPVGTGMLGVIPHAATTGPARTLSAASLACTNSTNCAGYESAIDRYFTDVAAASGTSTNVYSADTQYYDATGSIAYDSIFGGSYVDTSSFPKSGCSDAFSGRHDSVCLTSVQLETEIEKAKRANGWSQGRTSLFFIMLPSGVGVCFDDTPPSVGGSCTTNSFCAYHLGAGSSSNPLLFAVQPYNATMPGCTDGNSPNGDDADATINAISHEHNESITDPWGNGWQDPRGGEMADICVGQFGTALGSTADGEFNQVINGHDYWLQTEYSNATGNCVQSSASATGFPPLNSGGPLSLKNPTCTVDLGCWVMRTNTTYAIYWTPAPVTVPVNHVAPRVSGKAAFGRKVRGSTGRWTESPTRFTFRWLRCSAAGSRCVRVAGARASHTIGPKDVGHRLRVKVTATNSAGHATATSRQTAVVKT